MKYQEFKTKINNPCFSSRDLQLFDLPVYNYQLTLWKQKGYIQHLKRGLYYFTDAKDQLTSEEISFNLYEPSYISLEQALSVYGVIPDIVHATTAITSRKTRTFTTRDFGTFIYRHVKPELFFGYTTTETKYGKYSMAEPEKALLDFLYFQLPQINSSADIEGLRINYAELCEQISRQTIKRYLTEFNIKKLQAITHHILKQC